MGETDALRALMEADRWVDRVRSQRAHLPEIAELAVLEDELRGLLRELRAAESVLEPLRHDYEAAEEASTRLRTRAKDLDAAMSGSTNVREAAALQGELVQVRERLGASEDREIELLVALEPLQGVVDEVKARAQPGVARREVLRAAIVDLQSSLDEEITSLVAGRVERAAEVPLALLSRYDAAMARVGVSGAAHVVEGRCDGCRLALSPLDVDRWKAMGPETFMDCPECGRILLP